MRGFDHQLAERIQNRDRDIVSGLSKFGLADLRPGNLAAIADFRALRFRARI
jgi:hypothetical protein